jgi:hypothetical protein
MMIVGKCDAADVGVLKEVISIKDELLVKMKG